MRAGKEYSTLPKNIFPSLLKKLMENDFEKAIISGFEATGIYPTRYGTSTFFFIVSFYKEKFY